MSRVEDFAKSWSPRERTGIIDKIKTVVSPPPPVRPKLARALYKLRVQNNKLEYVIAKMRERDQSLFEKVVKAQMEKDQTHAAMYAAELAELRKMIKALVFAKTAVERITLRLETILIVGDTLNGLVPVVGVIKDIKKYLLNIVPEIGIELAEIGETLESIVMETGQFHDWTTAPSVYSEEAKKIMEEAAIVAEQRMKEYFPELPSALPSPSGEQQNK